MANATRSGKPRNIGLPRSVKFNVAADNDVLFTAYGTMLVIGMEVTGSVTGMTYNSADFAILTADNDAIDQLPVLCVAGTSDITALASGAGTITLYFYDVPTVTAGYTETAYTQV